MEYVEHCSEFGNIVKNYRELEVLKKILLKKEQREMFILPSINLKIEEIEPKEQENKENFIDKLNKANYIMKNTDLKKRENRILGKNIITSII